MIHRDTLLKKSKYTCFLHNADGFVAHSVSDLGGVSGQVWAVIYSLVTFWRDCEYFCRGLPYARYVTYCSVVSREVVFQANFHLRSQCHAAAAKRP